MLLWVLGASAMLNSSCATNKVLPTSQYAPAEAVYRSFLPGAQWPESGTNLVYCLAFGTAGAAMPSDFMARFPGPMPRVITGTNGLAFPMPGVTVEHESGRAVVILQLRSLSIHGDHAKARVYYITGSSTVSETLQLAQRDGRWRVMQMKREWEVAF